MSAELDILIKILTGEKGYRERVNTEDFPGLLQRVRPNLYELVLLHQPDIVKGKLFLDTLSEESLADYLRENRAEVYLRIQQESLFNLEQLQATFPKIYLQLLEQAKREIAPKLSISQKTERLPYKIESNLTVFEGETEVNYSGVVLSLWIEDDDVRFRYLNLTKKTKKRIEFKLEESRNVDGTYIISSSKKTEYFSGAHLKPIVEGIANNQGIKLPRELIDAIFDPIIQRCYDYLQEMR